MCWVCCSMDTMIRFLCLFVLLIYILFGVLKIFLCTEELYGSALLHTHHSARFNYFNGNSLLWLFVRRKTDILSIVWYKIRKNPAKTYDGHVHCINITYDGEKPSRIHFHASAKIFVQACDENVLLNLAADKAKVIFQFNVSIFELFRSRWSNFYFLCVYKNV